jgi:hypothetical protein
VIAGAAATEEEEDPRVPGVVILIGRQAWTGFFLSLLFQLNLWCSFGS